MISRRLLSLPLAAAVFLLAEPGPTGAQPKPLVPNPQAPVLKAPFPMGAQRGSTFDLTLTGTNLAGPVALLTTLPGKVTIPTDGNNGKDATRLLVRLEIPRDAPVGAYPIRLATEKGLSNVRLFCVDDLPQVLETADNRTVQTAQAVPVPCVVCGRCDAEVSDYFKITVQAGQRLSFEVLGRRLGSAFDPQLTLFDVKTGHELKGGHSNDAPGCQTDPRLTYTFKHAGEVAVQVRDVSWRGGEDFCYRLRIGDFPCATSAYPLAVKRGSKTPVGFAGPLVQGAAPVEVAAPTDPAVDSVSVAPRFADGPHGWPVTVLLSDLDEATEQEPNNEPAKANRVAVPGAVSGVLLDKGDVDHFVFAAKKGQRYVIDAQTSDLGSPCEVYLRLLDAKGGQVAASNPMQPGARVDYTAAADGDYTVAVEHLHYWNGPSEAYRLTFLPYEPGFELSVALDRFDVAAGGTLSLPLLVARQDYAGPITVSVEGQGLSGEVTIPMGQPPAKQPAGPLAVKADAGLAGPMVFRVKGTADINGKKVTKYASVKGSVSASLAGLPLPPRETFTAFGLTVKEAAAFTLTAKFEGGAAGGMPGKPQVLVVTAARGAGFAGEIQLSAAGLPANVTAQLKPIPAGMNEVKIEVLPAENAAVGQFPITVTGKAKHKDRDVTAGAAPALLILKK
jgi:hypothetical protein